MFVSVCVGVCVCEATLVRSETIRERRICLRREVVVCVFVFVFVFVFGLWVCVCVFVFVSERVRVFAFVFVGVKSLQQVRKNL